MNRIVHIIIILLTAVAVIIYFSFTSFAVNVTVQVWYGTWATENSWYIYDGNGATVLSGGPGSNNTWSYNGTISLIPGVYTIVGYDSYGDGWNGGGYYNVTPSAGTGTGTIYPSGGGTYIEFTVTGVMCSGNIYDNGNGAIAGEPAGNYFDNEDWNYTLYPSVGTDKVRLTFSSFNTENTYDYLYLDYGAGVISYTGTTSPGTVTSTFADGRIYVRFTSDASVTAAGWVAAVSCYSPCSNPSITAQPSNATICTGGSNNMSITASGATSYQWQYNSGTWNSVVNGTPAGSVYTNATTATVTIASISSAGAYQYRCAATNACGTTYSNAATLTVNADPSITAQPANATICLGGSYSPSVTVSGGMTVTYQWQYNSGTWNNVVNGTPAGSSYSNQTTATLTVSGITSTGTYQYRCVISDAGNGCTTPINSNTGTLTINADPSITVQPSNATICIGGTYSPSVTVSGGVTVTYQWQYNSGTWNNVVNGTPAGSTYSNQTTATMSVSGISSAGSYPYRCIISDAGNGCTTPLTSSTGTLTLNNDPSITVQPSNATICLGGTYSPSVTVSGGASVTYQWQYNSGTWNNVVNGTPAGSSYSNQTTATLTVNGITSTGTYQYRCVVSDAGNGCTTPINSNAGTLTINADPSITAQPADAMFCVGGGNTNFSVTVSGGVSLTYQWQYNSGSWNPVANGTPAGATYTNATTATMTVSGITAAGSYQYRCVISDAGSGCTTPLTSNIATFSVATTPPTSVDAGEDQYICANPATMAATGTGTWSVLNGTGTITTPTSATTTVNVTNPSTSVTFRWGQTNGCGTAYDDVVINRQ